MFHCNSIVQFILLNELYNYVFRKRNVMGPKQLRYKALYTQNANP